ncbi:MAG: HAMP domain-containing sensor histidine kinase [Polyangiaceae bacterium]
MSSAAARKVRFSLAAVNLLVVAMVLAITLGGVALSAARTSRAAIDRELRTVASRVEDRIQHELAEQDHGTRSSDEEEDDDDHHGERERARDRAPRKTRERALLSVDVGDEPSSIVLVATLKGDVLRGDGRALPAGLPDRESLASAFEGHEVTKEVLVDGERSRVLTVPIVVDRHVIGALQVARPTAEAEGALRSTLLVLAIVGAAGLVLSAAASLFLASRAMRPIVESMDRQRRFLADASHELRTPVAILRARAELLERELGADDRAARDVTQLRRDAEELSELLGDLLDLARLEAEEATLPLAAVPIFDVAEELAAQVAPLAKEKRIALEVRGASPNEEPLFAMANLSRLRQVLRALVDNALRHTPESGRIEIAVETAGPRHRIVVRDDGEGIAPEHLAKVTERFYRAEPQPSDDAKGPRGAGLGLAIAAELIRKMGGSLAVRSEKGKGTEITLELERARR